MRPRTTKLLLIVLAIVLSGVGCNRGEADSSGDRYKEEIVIGWTPGDITGVYKTATEFFEAGAEDANKHGFDVEVLSRAPSAHTAFAEQVAIIEDFVSRDVDVIAISPVDVEAIKPAIRQANEAGIPVILVNLLEQQPDVDIASYIGFDNADAAAVSAYSVLDYFGGPGVLGSGPNVDVTPDTYLDRDWWEKTYEGVDTEQPQASGAVVEGIAGTLFSQERLDGFHSVVDSYPGIELQGAPIAADWNREKGIKATETLLSRYGAGDLDFIWAASNEMGLGSMLTLGRRNLLATGSERADDKVAVFTNDVTPESVNAIKAGKIVAETHHGFAEWGWFGTRVGVQLACGQDVPQQVDIRPRTVWEGNAQLFYPDIELPEIQWDKIKADCA